LEPQISEACHPRSALSVSQLTNRVAAVSFECRLDTQGFPPGAPYKGPTGKEFVPFGVGVVQLGDVIRVESRLTENDPAKLQFGQEVELTMAPFTTDDDGNDIITFAFGPSTG
jgi:uncharacterized OB-fold protein